MAFKRIVCYMIQIEEPHDHEEEQYELARKRIVV
jgi:hypothetical protein